MPGLNDFMTSGNVPLAPSASTTQTQLPEWYTNYAMQLLSDQNGVGGQPYQTYQGPRVAGFNADNERAFELTRQVARPEGLQNIEGALGDLSGRSALGAASPYFSTAASMSGLGAASPLSQTGAGYFNSSTAPTGISLATPFLNQSGQTSASTVGQYMSPYQEGVLNRISDLGARNLREKFIPELQDRFIASGQMGGVSGEAPSRFGMELGRGIRDASEGVLAQQAQYLDKGYTDAMGYAGADLSRFGTLGSVAGNLGSDQQRILQSAGSGLGGLAQMQGSLTNADADRQLQLGTSSGSLYNTDTQNRMQIQQQMAALAKQRQEMGLTGAGALSAVGEAQRGNVQQNYDVGRADFIDERDYPQRTIDAGIGTLQGIKGAVPTGQTNIGYGPANADSILQNPSTLQKIATAVSTGLGVQKLFNP